MNGRSGPIHGWEIFTISRKISGYLERYLGTFGKISGYPEIYPGIQKDMRVSRNISGYPERYAGNQKYIRVSRNISGYLARYPKRYSVAKLLQGFPWMEDLYQYMGGRF